MGNMFDLLLDKAIESFLKGDIEEAKKRFASCLILKPDDKLAMLCYTIADLAPENPESARQLMRYALVAEESEIEEILYHIFDDDNNLIKTDNDIRSTSWLPDAKSKIAERVRDDLETAVKIDPDFSEAELFLGKIYREMGEYGTAAEHLHKSLLINPFELEAISEIESLITEYNKKPGKKEKN